MIIKTFITSPFQQNTRILTCVETGKTVCVDPGDSAEIIAGYLNENNFQLQSIMLTHGHLDHIGGVADLHKLFPQAEIILHKEDEDLYYGLAEQPIFMGIPPHQLKALGMDYEDPPALTRNWMENEIYEAGSLRFRVLHCPGHTRGHVVFVEDAKKALIGGDCLFAGSIGRTDLPGGNYDQLISSIKEKILPLGDDFIVYSGHGDDTNIGQERLTNPFLTGIYQLS